MSQNEKNVIDFVAAREQRLLRKGKGSGKDNGLADKVLRDSVLAPVSADLVDITEKRHDILEEERRKVKRTILTEFVAAHVIVPARGLLKVALYDISIDGLAFDLDPKIGAFQLGEEVAMRVYLNHQTYFPFQGRIQNIRLDEGEGVLRHGLTFLTGGVNDEALRHFVMFIETVSASLKTDRGDVMVSKIVNR